jgi:dihydroorotase
MYDLLVKGGRVIDPANKRDGLMDVAVNGRNIAAVAKNIPEKDARKVLDARGKIVTPGLIDMHCHVYDGGVKNGAPIDTAGVRQGVTTVVDAGSAGQAIFPAFPKFVIPRARTSVYCFLHICSTGQAIQPEPGWAGQIDPSATTAMVKAYPGLIKGIKIRLVGDYLAKEGLATFKIAKKVAKDCGLPIMVHIGDTDCKVPASLTREFLPLMEKGDILSHGFTAKQGSTMLEGGKFVPEFKAAIDRGMIFDIAHGRFNCSYAVARNGLAQGIIPDTISSDITLQSLAFKVFGLTVTISKFLTIGLTLNQVITMTTINPAKALGIDGEKGSFAPGKDADISILEFIPGKWQLIDAENEVLTAKELVTPFLTVIAGKVVLPKIFARPENAA